jgi:hypothetical protein
MPKPKQQRRLLVGIVLDRSSSMSVIVDATISNTNEQFSALRDSDDAANTFVAFNTFANTVTPVLHDGSKDRNPILVPVNALEDISDVNYRPSGMTAMYDGVDAMITFLSAEAKHNDDVMVVVISDGAENASRNITSAELASKIKELQDSDWNFTYIGANQDLTQVAADLGIHVGNMLSFQAHDAGVDLMGNTVSTAIRSYAGNRSSHIASGNDTRLSTKSLYSPENVKDDGHVVGDTVEGSTTLKTNPDVVLVSSEDEIA